MHAPFSEPPPCPPCLRGDSRRVPAAELERSFVEEAILLADDRNVRVEAEFAGAQAVFAPPLGVAVAEQLGGAAGVERVVGGMVHLAVLAAARIRRAEHARAHLEGVLAHED